MIEIERLEDFDRMVENGGIAGAVLQGIDLTHRTRVLLEASLHGTVFLGCKIEHLVLRRAIDTGALVFPRLPELPYSPYRNELYTVDDLYDGFVAQDPISYRFTPDALIYAHWKKAGGSNPPSILETLAQRLHDHAITDAMNELLAGKKVVAIMGGHSMARGAPEYRTVARIAWTLTRKGFFVASGGGPGAMEAAHLGAYFASRGAPELDEAIDMLAGAPKYTDTDWLARAFVVRGRFPHTDEDLIGCASLGIPTWHYGHEPPNAFATYIAKYFANSVREDGLLTIAKNGIIFSPGSAGTIQEIFQDACQNHYVTCGAVSPMIFLGHEYWQWKKPVFPLLAQLAAGQEYGRWLLITDDADEVVKRIEVYDRAVP